MKSTPASKLAPFLTFVLALASVSSVSADVVLSKLFGDHMVLQQNQPIRIWGQADPGEQVTTGEKRGRSSLICVSEKFSLSPCLAAQEFVLPEHVST